MRYLGIDYGEKRIGLAVSSEGIAFPHGVFQNDDNFFATLIDFLSKERIGCVVVGDTRSFGGLANPVTKDVEKFVALLREHIDLPVVSAPEAGSSIEASRYRGDTEKHDDSAAALILQRFLDSKGKVDPVR